MIISFFSYLLKVSICSIILYGFYHLVLRKQNFFQLNRVYLIASVFLSLLIPLFQITIHESELQGINTFIGFDDRIEKGVNEVFLDESIAAQQSFLNEESFLFVLYLLGLGFFGIKLIVNLIKVLKLKSKGEIRRLQNHTLVETELDHPIFSFMNMIFWNKSLTYSEEEARQIILHEQVHVDQKHSLDILFLELTQILLWFNPFIYLFKSSLKNTHEYIADQQIYQKYNYQIRYVDLLMKEAKLQRSNSLPVVHTFFNNQLKKRLIMIKNSNKHSSKFRILACLPIITMLVFTFSIDANVLAQTSADAEIENTKKGNIYVARDADNELTLTDDGVQRTDEEIKDYIVEKNATEGKVVNRNQVFVMSKEDLHRNLNGGSDKNYPEYKGNFRLWLSANGRLGVSVKSKTEAKTLNPLKVLSFDADINKPVGESNGKLNYKSMYLNYEGSKLNKAALEFIDSIEATYRKKANVVFKNIVVEENDKKYIISKETKLPLKF